LNALHISDLESGGESPIVVHHGRSAASRIEDSPIHSPQLVTLSTPRPVPTPSLQPTPRSTPRPIPQLTPQLTPNIPQEPALKPVKKKRNRDVNEAVDGTKKQVKTNPIAEGLKEIAKANQSYVESKSVKKPMEIAIKDMNVRYKGTLSSQDKLKIIEAVTKCESTALMYTLLDDDDKDEWVNGVVGK